MNSFEKLRNVFRVSLHYCLKSPALFSPLLQASAAEALRQNRKFRQKKLSGDLVIDAVTIENCED
jgi:aryl-alcohol dehydrogenase-like predicted oxidoreductase